MCKCYRYLLFFCFNLFIQYSLQVVPSIFGKFKLKKTNLLLPAYKTYYIEQEVDHFGYANNDKFKLRYLVCDKYWNGGNQPIFFYTGNEGDITLFYQNTGLMFDWAVEFNALIVFAEHRYYGVSLPYGNSSFKDALHTNYFTAEQALADFAYLITYLKKTVRGAENSPVIAFGGSYGGMLSAWIRMKYPFIITGSLAASAPIWQIGDLTPCGDFLQLVTNDFKNSGKNCDLVIRKSWKAINNLASKDEGLTVLSNIFGLCNKLNSSQALKDWLSGIYTNLAMINYPYPADFLEPLPAWPIQKVCQYLTNPDLPDFDLLGSLRKLVDVYFNYTGSSNCYNVDSQSTSSLDDSGWDYQTCTEMMMPMCSDGVRDMFELSIWNETQFANECWRKWKVRPRPQAIYEQFGRKNIQYASNIIFSNGLLDPWSVGGVLYSVSDSLVSLIIKRGAHHLDLRSSDPQDPSDVILARIQEKKYIKQWIQEHNQKVEKMNKSINYGNNIYYYNIIGRIMEYDSFRELLIYTILFVSLILSVSCICLLHFRSYNKVIPVLSNDSYPKKNKYHQFLF